MVSWKLFKLVLINVLEYVSSSAFLSQKCKQSKSSEALNQDIKLKVLHDKKSLPDIQMVHIYMFLF